MFVNNVLYLLCWIISFHLFRYECYGNSMIMSSDGNLFIHTEIHKNISFETNDQCAVLIDGEDLVKGPSVINNVDSVMKKYEYILRSSSSQMLRYWFLLIVRNGIGQRIKRLENATKTFTNSSLDKYEDVNNIRSEVTSLKHAVVQLNRLLTKNECRSSPCKNGGTCQDLFNGVYCTCASGWEGFTCEKDVDECVRFNSTDLGCQNGGVCVNKPGTYECVCVNGWYGLHCTRKTTDCNSGSVAEICGHGTCVPQNNAAGYKCLCDQGWEKSTQGNACTQDVDECEEENPRCSRNPPVSCENTLGSFRCGSCPTGYTGNGFYCSDINECELFNGGCSMNPMVDCQNIPGSKKCGPCPPGYVGNGITCSYRGICNINNGNCHSLAVCREYPSISSTYAECTCPAGYTGNGIGPMGCVPSTSPCDPNPCNNGRCIPKSYTLEGFICKCHGMYYGKHCELTDGLCGSNPCRNGATCVAHNTTSYECICLPEYTGSDCSIVKQECGGNLGLMEQGTISFPTGFSTQLVTNFDCSWKILTEVEKIFNLTFQSFDVGKSEKCDNAWLQVVEGERDEDKISRKFCGNTLPNNGSLLSSTNKIVINLKNDGGSASFQLKWVSLDTKCHEKYNLSANSSGIIRSPGAPGTYPNNKDCFWYLQGPISGKLITLTFHSFNIGNDTDCTGDYLEVFSSFTEGQDLLAKICGGSIPASLTSFGPEVLIRFHSDDKNTYSGFQINYELTHALGENVQLNSSRFIHFQDERGCGGVFKKTKGFIYSPTSPINNGQICFYQIQQKNQQKTKLTFTALSLDDSPGCTVEYVELYEGQNSSCTSIGRYCGETIPASYISPSNIIFVKFKRKQASANFTLKYEAVCGGIFEAPSGVIQSEGYPVPYTSDITCVYLIKQAPGLIITLDIQDLDLEYNYDYDDECSYDYLEVRDGDNEHAPIIGSYCSSPEDGPIISSSNGLWLKFVSDYSDNGRGFKANYTSTTGTGCGGPRTNRTGVISLGSEGQRYGRKSCRWILQAPPGFVIKIFWITFDMINNYNCISDYVSVYENNSYYKSSVLIGTYCGSKRPPMILTSSNVATISASLGASKEIHEFTAQYVFLNETTVCGGDYFTSSGVIKSPRYPESYPPHSDCVWTISVPPGQQIRLQTETFVGITHCKYQYLEIRNGHSAYSPLIDRFCNSRIPKVIVSQTNQLYLHTFGRSYKENPSKFKFTWTSTATGCGGTLTSASGTIASPHYPEPYSRMTECSWKIIVNQGSLIQFLFLDLDLESINSGRICSFDFVEIFDGISKNSESLGTFCSNPVPTSLMTSENQADVFFRSDLSFQGRGFNLKYRSVCSNSLTGYGGVIESPNFPEPNSLVQDCYWNITVSKKNRINITFSHFDMNEKNHIGLGAAYYYRSIGFPARRENYLEIKYMILDEIGDEKYIDFGTYNSSTSVPDLITIPSDHALLHFKSDTNMLGSGFRLEWIIDGCGGHLTKPGNITSPNYPGKYPHGIECDWLIEAPYGYSIVFNFTFVDIEREEGCLYDSIEIFNGPDSTYPSLGKLCLIDRPEQFTSNGHLMQVHFTSDSSFSGKGFASNFHFIKSKCGGKMTAATGTIMSPNYPKNFDRYDACVWLIITDENHVIDFEFENVDLIVSSNCYSSYVNIYDGSSEKNSLLAKICDDTSSNKTFTSTTNQMLVVFKASSVRTHGFKANYYKACGARIEAQESSGNLKLQPFSLPSSERNQNCSWTIIAPNADQHVSLTITHLDLTGFAGNDEGVTIYNGESSNSPLIGNYLESKLPPTIVSNGVALHVVVNRDVNFFATYNIFGSNCGGLLTGLKGMFSSPEYPKSYSFNTACEWTIQLAPGNEVSLSFQNFDVPASPQCNEDFLEIRKINGNGRLLGVFCGDKKPTNITNQGSLWIYFKASRDRNDSAAVTTAKGFLAEYVMNTEIELKGYSGEIGSPLYPQSFTSSDVFRWTISNGNSRSRILVEFKDLCTESFNEQDCYSSYVNVYDGADAQSTLLGSFCGTRIPASIESSSSVIHIEASMNSRRLLNKFLLKWSQIYYSKRLAGEESCSSNEIIDISKLHRYNFSSPGYPDGYQARTRCEWNFRTSEMQSLRINFTDLSLGNWHSCILDQVKIFSKNSLVKTVCNRRHKNIFYNTSNLMRIVFRVNSYRRGKGFAAIISESCGGKMTSPSGTILFNENTPRDSKCQWTISVRAGRTVELKFSEFSFLDNDECANYISIKNGLYNSSPNLGIGKYCNQPPLLLTTSNNLYFEFNGNPNRSSFKASYEEISYDCGVDVTLSEETPYTLISSPNYPNSSQPFVECYWTIKSPPGSYIQLDFENLFDFHSNTECSTEAVELRDGGTDLSPLINKFCDKAPGSQFSSDNMMFVRFFTETKNPGRGFSANVTTASCGGTYKRNSGEISWYWDRKIQLVNRNCLWHIIAPPYASLSLKITFTGLRLSSSSCLKNGNFSLYEVARTPPHKVEKLGDMCDGVRSKNLTTLSNHVIIQFTDIMKSYKYYSPSRISVVYNATKTECVYTENFDFGTIQSPGYPHLNYLEALCSWTITVKEGRRITLNITDLDLDRYSSTINENGQYLKFYDYGEYYLETLSYNSTKRIIKSSGNKLQVLFFCTQSTNHRGFSAYYTSNEETVCNEDFSGERGRISRNRNEVQYSCLYKNIQTVPIKRTLVLKVQSLIVNQSEYNKRSSIKVMTDPNNSGEKLFSTIKSTPRPIVVRTVLPETFIKIHIATADANFTIDYEHHPCGGSIKGEKGFLSTPGYPLKYSKNLECAWVINLPVEHQVKLDFPSFNLGDDCEKSFIIVYNGKYSTSPRIGKFCNTNKPDQIVSQKNYLLIEYHYEETSTAIGFNATYEPVIKGCGGVFSDDSRIIETPNYPTDYPNNAECRWTIVVEEGFHLELKSTSRFHLEETEGCKNDYVEVFDWKNDKWVTFGKKCGRNLQFFKSSENKMLIIFRSNERTSGVGFQLKWKKNCGGTFHPSYDKKYIISPGYPYGYDNNLRCTYGIYSVDSFTVEFEDFSLEGEYPMCTNDKIRISSAFSHTKGVNQVYCGMEKPEKYRARYLSTIIFTTDGATSDKGFKFSVKTEGCGETITTPRVLSVNSSASYSRGMYRTPTRMPIGFAFERHFVYYSPYTMSMTYPENCLWNVTAPKEKVIVLKFTHFSSAQSFTCSFNALEVYDGSKRDYRYLLARLCGLLDKELPVLTSSNNSILMYFKQLSTSNAHSFSVDISFAPGPSEGCGGVFNLTKSKVIKPPQNQFNMDCQWKFVAAENYRIHFNFKSLNLPVNCSEKRLHGSNNCTCSFVEIRDGSGPFSELVDQLCSTVKNYSDTFETTWKFGFLRFYSIGNSTDAFEVTVTPVLDLCGPHKYIVTKEVQTLTSPGFPGGYPENIKCVWTITKESYFDNLILRFVQFDLTYRAENVTENICTHDRVEIDESDRNTMYKGTGNKIIPKSQKLSSFHMLLSNYKEILQFCGKETKTFDMFSSTNSINVAFLSTSEKPKGKGFKLEFFLSGCNYNFTQDSGRIVMQEVKTLHCSVYITSSENSTISLYFNIYWFFVGNNSGSMEVYDGHTTNSPLLLKHTNYGSPPAVFSNSNKMLITVSNSNIKRNTYSKIDATFISSTKGKGCGGKIVDRTGVITSPMYPKGNTSDSVCEWEIQGPLGVQMSISFRIFDISAPCDVNYLKITTYSRRKANDRTFCAEDSISTLNSDSKVLIVYKSSIRNTGKGWIIKFKTVSNNNFISL